MVADHCAFHLCQNDGECEFDITRTGYTCKCPDNYGGPFCEEELGERWPSEAFKSYFFYVVCLWDSCPSGPSKIHVSDLNTIIESLIVLKT